MPADGEFLFSVELANFARSEYRHLKSSKCVRTGVANAGMISIASYLFTYAKQYDHRKSAMVGVPVFIAALAITVGFCERERVQKT